MQPRRRGRLLIGAPEVVPIGTQALAGTPDCGVPRGTARRGESFLPNLLPIVVFFGVMAQLGILLNVGTSLIAAISLGIAVDSTIHYMARLARRRGRASSMGPRKRSW